MICLCISVYLDRVLGGSCKGQGYIGSVLYRVRPSAATLRLCGFKDFPYSTMQMGWSKLNAITLMMGSVLNKIMLIMGSNQIWSELKMIITLIMGSNHNMCDEGGYSWKLLLELPFSPLIYYNY
jgi:hypothetical protein